MVQFMLVEEKTQKIRGMEPDLGNAAELAMVIEEIEGIVILLKEVETN